MMKNVFTRREAELLDRAETAEARAKELEAQFAAMREALELSVKALEDSGTPCRDGKEHDRCEVCYAANVGRDALLPDAGRAMLERVEAMEKVVAEVRRMEASFLMVHPDLVQSVVDLDALEAKR